MHDAAATRVVRARERLAAAEERFDGHSGRVVELGLARQADDRDVDPAGDREAMRKADALLGRARIELGDDDASRHSREAQRNVRELVAEQIRLGGPAEALAAVFGADLFTKSGAAGGALEVGGWDLTKEFAGSRAIEGDVHNDIAERERSLAAEIARAEEDLARTTDEAGRSTSARALHDLRASAEREIAELRREAPSEVISRQRRQLTSLVTRLWDKLAEEQAAEAVPGVRELSRRELDEFGKNLSRIELKLKKMIIEDARHRGYHELLDRDLGRHPDFGAKFSDAKYNNATEMFRGVNGWVEAKENRHNEKVLARQIFADGHVENLIDTLLWRVNNWIPHLPGADRITDELASGVSAFDPRRRLGLYVSYFRRANLPDHLAHLESAVSNEPNHVLAVLDDPARFDLREKIMVLHDLAEYFGPAKYTPRTHGTGMLPEAPESEIQSTTEVDERGYRVASSGDRGRNPITRPDGDVRDHQPTRNENAASTMLARERRIPVWSGASFTAVNMFKLAEMFHGSRYEIGAVAYGVFAFWRLHFDHATWLAYHTLHEVLDIAQNFGLRYTLDDQMATVGTISLDAAVQEARSLATALEQGTASLPDGGQGVRPERLRPLVAALEDLCQAVAEAITDSEKVEAGATLLTQLEHIKRQVGLATTLGANPTSTT